MSNQLAGATSPYLLQHKDNPVHWRPWGPDALAEAKETGKPILLSVGYAACHWCHVMAHESFEDPDTAALMNELFVNIKVDREERPDVDALYMNALHLLGEQGGWPLTMFLTPEGEPFWGGTYFPPEARWGRPAFRQVLKEIARVHAEESHVVDNNRTALKERLTALARVGAGPELTLADVDAGAEAILRALDPVHGGTQGAPKFPNGGILELMFRVGLRRGDARFAEAALLALDRICQGGIYDHLGGGFARYSVDARWLVPHFEKMLYDNAQLLELLALAWQVTGRPLFRQRAEETVTWLAREMTTEDGAFASSLDADSEGVEGKFYVWSAAEIAEALREDAEGFMKAYDVSSEGNWEGTNILNRLAVPPGTDPSDDFAEARARLLARRGERVRPGRDDKVLADWNGLAIAALARASMVFGRPDWLDMARRAFAFVAEVMGEGDQLVHSARQGRTAQDGGPPIAGLAADYANMAAAALALHEATGDPEPLARAEAWMEHLETHFAGESGGYYMAAAEADDLMVRPRGASDDAVPGADSAAVSVLARLECFTGNVEYGERARRILGASADAARQLPLGYPRLLAAADQAATTTDVVVAGLPEPQAQALLEAAWTVPAPSAVRRAAAADDLHAGHAAARRFGGGPEAFVCAAGTCSLPLSDPESLKTEIARRRTA